MKLKLLLYKHNYLFTKCFLKHIFHLVISIKKYNRAAFKQPYCIFSINTFIVLWSWTRIGHSPVEFHPWIRKWNYAWLKHKELHLDGLGSRVPGVYTAWINFRVTTITRRLSIKIYYAGYFIICIKCKTRAIRSITTYGRSASDRNKIIFPYHWVKSVDNFSTCSDHIIRHREITSQCSACSIHHGYRLLYTYHHTCF